MNDDFKPYVPANENKPEMTIVSMVTGIILAVVFGAANAYLGLRVGMTISASIPAAVISMCIIRKIMKRDSILENNMVQTIGSAGESLAAGAIFTFPALFLWAKEGVMDTPGLVELSVVALIGGCLGVLFMVPLRKALIVDEHKVLPYPEGTACAEVLMAGEQGNSSSKAVFYGMGLAAAMKLLMSGCKVVSEVITAPIKALKTQISINASPSIIAVGYICGLKISSCLFAGGIIAWFVLIPAIVLFGADTVLFPATTTVAQVYAQGGADAIWSNYIRYIGAGAVAMAGIISLCKSLPLIVKTFIGAVKGIKRAKSVDRGDDIRTARDMDIRVILVGVVLIIALLWLLPVIPFGIGGAIMTAVMGFFFGVVSSRMVGLVGTSNNPASGMTIATLLVATTLFKLTGLTGAKGMAAAIIVGSIICIIAAMAGDTSQDLKTGFIVGATPQKQQIGELVGAFAAALAIGGVMVLLDKAWGFGSQELAAPQATLMKMIVEGIMDGNLPWGMIGIGAFISVAIELLGISSLAVAIGIYLPFDISVATMIGGVLRYFVDKKKKDSKESSDNESGVLFCSGMIAGEGLMGILLAILTVVGVNSILDISEYINTGMIGSIVAIIAIVVLILNSRGRTQSILRLEVSLYDNKVLGRRNRWIHRFSFKIFNKSCSCERKVFFSNQDVYY